MLRLALMTLALLAALAGPACNCSKPIDDDPDAGSGGEGEEGEGEGEGEGEPKDAGPSCSEFTPGFGEPCTTDDLQPPCGTYQCNPAGELACAGPPRNDCGGCGDLDQAAGHIGERCGTFGCGTVDCDTGGTKTVCLDADRPQNQCGGCQPLQPSNAVEGEPCSSCQSGVRTCGEDQESLYCVHGREPDNQCGGCDRCVLMHAFMVDVAPGGFLLPGTRVIIEDIGGGSGGLGAGSPIQLSFDPLVEGPGADGLPSANVYLSATPDPFDGTAFAYLDPAFAFSMIPPLIPADPARPFVVDTFLDLSDYRYVVVADNSGLFLDPVIAVGELVAGPPPE